MKIGWRLTWFGFLCYMIPEQHSPTWMMVNFVVVLIVGCDLALQVRSATNNPSVPLWARDAYRYFREFGR